MAVIYKAKTYLQLYDALKRWLIGESSTLNNFNAGSRLNTLLEAFALLLSQTHTDFYQGLKAAIPTSVYNAFEFERKAGTKASGTLEFTRTDPATQDYPIAIGTAIILDGVKFETVASGQIDNGNTTSGNVAAQASELGFSGNIASGAIDTVIGQGSFVNQPDGVEAAKNNVAFVGGTEEESDQERIARFRSFINSLARATVQGLITAATSVEGIVSASVIEHLPSAGWVTVFADDGTGTLSAAKKAEVEKVINGDPTDVDNFAGYRGAGIRVAVVAPSIVSVNVTADVKILDTSGADPTTLKATVQTAIENYINTLRLGEDVIVNEIVKVAKVSDVEVYDIDITVPAANVSITGGQVARTGTLLITHSFVSI